MGTGDLGVGQHFVNSRGDEVWIIRLGFSFDREVTGGKVSTLNSPIAVLETFSPSLILTPPNKNKREFVRSPTHRLQNFGVRNSCLSDSRFNVGIVILIDTLDSFLHWRGSK